MNGMLDKNPLPCSCQVQGGVYPNHPLSLPQVVVSSRRIAG